MAGVRTLHGHHLKAAAAQLRSDWQGSTVERRGVLAEHVFYEQ